MRTILQSKMRLIQSASGAHVKIRQESGREGAMIDSFVLLGTTLLRPKMKMVTGGCTSNPNMVNMKGMSRQVLKI